MIVPARFRFFIGIPLFFASVVGIAYFGGLIGPVHLPRFTVHLWQVLPFVTTVVVLSLGQRAIGERRLIRDLNSLADSTENFRDDTTARKVPPLGRRWQTVRGEYVERYGKRAARLLKGTDYADAAKYALRPNTLQDFSIVAVMLKTYASSLSQNRSNRWRRLCLRDAALAAGIFSVTWVVINFQLKGFI